MSKSISELDALLNAETSAAVPRISNIQLLNAPENSAIKAIWTQQYDGEKFKGKKLAVIATDGVEEIELTTVLHFFKAQGATVDLLAPKKPSFPAFIGLQIPDIRESHILTIRYIEPAGWVKFDKALPEANAADYDAVIVPGGTWNPDVIREDKDALRLVTEANDAGKVVAAICHGPWVLSDAGITKGRRATAWWSIRRDIENAGATYLDEPVVVDGNLITSRAPIDLAYFIKAIEDALISG